MRQRKTVWKQEVGYGWCHVCTSLWPHALIPAQTPSCTCTLHLEHTRAQMCPAVQMGGLQPHFAANEKQLFSGQEASRVMLRNAGAHLLPGLSSIISPLWVSQVL